MRTFFGALALVIAGFVGGALSMGAHGSAALIPESELVQELKARGWQTSTTDHVEALYWFDSGDVNTNE